ncbi:hypothetical protein AMAG_20566 [Allomyces macrogynus ATCC 38327]|uniref:Arf-GAP with coiled-coil, ANK repeat and PH domain-containing protein n=1 Tax=Allomyces macrogynus (strain ATCC 38327) TaxID=578462 RepID=A0A0L0TCQ2_ALLM3|nr:hypothetical protein AMAG_20566 [Allomyces macrogynus ATCC 38327]|eukprot:KNE72324.1 hypothetical protein AMAG_20566 [Allomyces macrogynus ATCC 38327]
MARFPGGAFSGMSAAQAPSPSPSSNSVSAAAAGNSSANASTPASPPPPSAPRWRKIRLQDCLHDPPAHRKRIEDAELAAAQLEAMLRALTRVAKNHLDAMKYYHERTLAFYAEMQNTTEHIVSADPASAALVGRVRDLRHELEQRYERQCQQLKTAIIDSLEIMLIQDIGGLKELRKRFEYATDSLDSTLDKYLSKKSTDSGVPEAARDVAEARKSFHEAALNYSMALNTLRSRRAPDFVTLVVSHLQTAFLDARQGADYFADVMRSVQAVNAAANESAQQAAEASRAQTEMRRRLLEGAASVYNPINRGWIDGIKTAAAADPGATAAMEDSDDEDEDEAATPDTSVGSNLPVLKAGYLLKKNQNQRMARHSWSRRYFEIKGDLLVYSQRGKDEEPVVAINLRVSTVKPGDSSSDRRYVFQVISSQKSYTLQAENEEDMNHWIESLQRAIGAALHSTAPPSMQGLSSPTSSRRKGRKKSSAKGSAAATAAAGTVPFQEELSPRIAEANRAMEAQKQVLSRIRHVPGNTHCADCGAADPEWASINLGVVFCITCSGLHRSMGVHVSKVRSIILDTWDAATVEVMVRLGNTAVNGMYLGAPATPPGITPAADRNAREKWIMAKYVGKEFLARDRILGELRNMNSAVASGPPTVHEAFWDAVTHGQLARALGYLAVGADVDWRHPGHGYRAALHQVIASRDEIGAEFLLQWQCNVNQQDHRGQTPLHVAAEAANARITVRLLKRSADPTVKNTAQQTPLALAETLGHANVCTVLRLFAVDQSGNARSSDFGIQEALSQLQHLDLDAIASAGPQAPVPVGGPGSLAVPPAGAGAGGAGVSDASASVWGAGPDPAMAMLGAKVGGTAAPATVSDTPMFAAMGMATSNPFLEKPTGRESGSTSLPPAVPPRPSPSALGTVGLPEEANPWG